jgi:catechol 2,3-dioxygenase-like lactoylglutathione lyase family enzyme
MRDNGLRIGDRQTVIRHSLQGGLRTMADEQTFRIARSLPIFAVRDVPATLKYYCDVLGFSGAWTWDDPPTFGGACWGSIGVMFCRQPEIAAHVRGHMHSFFVEGIDALHERHRAAGAEIVIPLQDEPWGLREYTVRDPDGYHLRFGEPAHRKPTTREPLATLRIVERRPTVEEYGALIRAVGWERFAPPERREGALAGARYAIVALDGETVIGTGLVVNDGAGFYYLKDVMVHPGSQGRGVGTAILKALITTAVTD